MTETLQGLIDRITYTSEDDGYSVIKVRVKGRRDLVTVVGNFVSISPGEVLRMEGSWGVHAKFGEQFKAERYETAVPATVEGIRMYLGSGLIKGIGPKMAGRIVARFGTSTLDVIEVKAERLREVEGIGKVRVMQIRKAWEDQKEIRDVMVFLRGHGVGVGWAARIFRHYGKESLKAVRENPYRLAMDVKGIGFLTADRIAENLGMPKESPLRAQAGILYTLEQGAEEGHVCAPRAWLLEKAAALLAIPGPVLEEALGSLCDGDRLVAEELPEAVAATFGDKWAVYLGGYHTAEVQVARRLAHLGSFLPLKRKLNPETAIDWLRGSLPFKLAPLQEDAVRRSITDKVIVITGGPGTGKTTLVRAILAVYRKLGAHVCLSAPTGRAAKRLSESTRHPAATLHRVLEFSPQLNGFQRNENKPIPADLIIVDETSMIDIRLMHYLLKAVPAHATLVLVGDVDQLPSVGPGNVLGDIIGSGKYPVVRLTEIFRQARQSLIVMNAHRIRDGEFPYLGNDEEEGLRDFYFIEKEDPEQAANLILKLCTERIPARFKFDPIDDVQVLSPMHRGAVGAQRLNVALQQALNPSGPSIERGGRLFRVGDKVMQVRNNYDKDVYNGDLGRISRIDAENQLVRVDVDGRKVEYDFSEIDELALAYAMSVHKAQGSEYPAVIFPVMTQHYMMLQRNLLYTAITRARKLVIIVGTRKALAMTLRNNRTQQRFTLLRERLSGELPNPVQKGFGR